jgi:hypothetical protein
MKTVTTRQFYHNAKLVDELPEGGQLVVTSNGKPKFIVTRYGERPKMTRKFAKSLVSDWGTPANFDSVAFLRSLKK